MDVFLLLSGKTRPFCGCFQVCTFPGAHRVYFTKAAASLVIATCALSGQTNRGMASNIDTAYKQSTPAWKK